MRRGGFRGAHRQGGAIGLLGAIVMSLVVLCTALALDTGRLYMEKRNLQRVADLAALEAMSRASLPNGDAEELAKEAAARNDFDPDKGEVNAKLGGVSVEDGRHIFVPITTGETIADSLQVVAEKQVPTSLVANLAKLVDSDIPSNLNLSAKAVASRTGTAAFTLDSGVLSLDDDNSALLEPLLEGVLGSDLDLSVVDSKGLLGANLTLLELVEAMPSISLEAVSTMDELLGTKLSVTQLADLMAEVLRRRQEDGELADVDLRLLGMIEEGEGVELSDITLGELLEVEAPTGGRDEALNTQLRLGDLLGVGLLAANGDNAINLNIASGTLGEGIDELDSVFDLDVGVTVVEPPKLAIGPPGRLESPEGARHWRTEVMAPQLSVSASTFLDLGLVSFDLGLRLDSGSGKAALESLDPGGEADILVKPALAALYLGDSGDLSDPFGAPPDPLSIRVLGTNDVALADIRVSSQAVASGSGDLVVDESDQRLTFSPSSSACQGGSYLPCSQETDLETGDSLSGLLSSLGENLDIDIDVLSTGDDAGSSGCGLLGLDCIIDGIVDTVVQEVVEPIVKVLLEVLAPLVGNIGEDVLQPLLDLLGIDLNTLEVTLLDVSTTQVELVK